MIWEYIWPYIFFMLQKVVGLLQLFYWKKYECQNDFKQSAHVCRIICRYKDSVKTGKFNFIYVHHSFRHPRIVLQDNISLYHIEDNEAIFVDCGMINIFDSKRGSFMYDAQFKYAINIIIMPISSAEKISREILVPNIPILHAANHSRCGSTLLFRLFESVPDVLSISEPKSFENISEFSRLQLVNDNILHDMCEMALKMLIKHAVARKSKIFFKCSNTVVFITDIIYDVMPQIKHIYMYRDPIPFVRSCEKLLFVNNWPPPDVQALKPWAGIGGHSILNRWPLLYEDYFYKSLSTFAKISLIWILGTCAYNQLIKKGYPIKAFKYEDLLCSSNECMKKLFDYMEVKFDNKFDFSHVLKQDSQEGSQFTSRNFDKSYFDKALTKLNETLKAEVDRLCYDFDVPLFWKGVTLPKSI